jgi:UDP-GlcNAc:undecaprenyl-phosphate GlcNAc-1-phosphate transferase
MTGYLLAFLGTFFAIVVLAPLARRVRWVDSPGGRKMHEGHIPLTGGAAMAIGVGLSVSQFPGLHVHDMLSLLGAATGMLVIGVWDDQRGVSARLRIVLTLIVSMLIVRFEHFQLRNLGDLLGFGDIPTGILAVPFTLFCIVGVVNALNMSDGMDGLAGGLSAIALLAMTWVALFAGRSRMILLCGILFAAVVGFLCFNARTPFRKRAAVFMGDAGSMFLGFLIAALLIYLSQPAGTEQRAMTPVTALWLFALPLLDTISVLVWRIARGSSPFKPDREHFHHMLQDAGYTPGQSVAIMWAVAALLAVAGLCGNALSVPQSWMFAGFLGLFVVYLLGMRRARRLAEKLRSALHLGV